MKTDNLIKVKSYPDFRKDPSSGAIIEINKSKIDIERNRLSQSKQQRDELDQLKNDVGEIKNLLNQLLEKKA